MDAQGWACGFRIGGGGMLWLMTGTSESVGNGWFEKTEPVRTFVEADSMDEAFEIARGIYGSGITGAQVYDEHNDGLNGTRETAEGSRV